MNDNDQNVVQYPRILNHVSYHSIRNSAMDANINESATEAIPTTRITGIGICCVFAHNYTEAFNFYHELLGLREYTSMNDNSCYFIINDSLGLYLIGGYALPARETTSVGVTFAFEVTSILDMYQRLQSAGTRLLHAEPMQMNETTYWFQCCDPSGNIIEFIGEK